MPYAAAPPAQLALPTYHELKVAKQASAGPMSVSLMEDAGPKDSDWDAAKINEKKQAAFGAMREADAGLVRACDEGGAEEASAWLALGADPDTRFPIYAPGAPDEFKQGSSALWLACQSGSELLVEALLAAGSEPDDAGPGRSRALGAAWVQAGNGKGSAMPSLLLSVGATFGAEDFAIAVHARDSKAMRAMIDRGFDLRAPRYLGLCAMEYAVDRAPFGMEVATGCLRIALDAGVDLGGLMHSGASLAMRAAARGAREVLALLDGAGALDCGLASAEGFRAADFARASGFSRLAGELEARAEPSPGRALFPLALDSKVLESWGFDATAAGIVPVLPPTDLSPDALLLRALRASDLDAVRGALADGSSPDACDALGTAALYFACAASPEALAVELVQTLLDAGADPNPAPPEIPRDDIFERGYQAYVRASGLLRFAAGLVRPGIVERLVGFGADADDNGLPILESSGQSVMDMVADPQTIRALASTGFDPQARPWVLSRTVQSLASSMPYRFHAAGGEGWLAARGGGRWEAYQELVKMAGSEEKAGVRLGELASLAMAGYEKYALSILERWDAAGVDFTKPERQSGGMSMVDEARQKGWGNGASWMASAPLARLEREALFGVSTELGVEAHAAPTKPKRRSL